MRSNHNQIAKIINDANPSNQLLLKIGSLNEHLYENSY